MMAKAETQRSFFQRVCEKFAARQTDSHNARLFSSVNAAVMTRVSHEQAPVLFFNASTRLGRTSLNAAFAWLTAAGLMADGVPVTFFVCRHGMKPCLLGTNRDDPSAPMMCQACEHLSDQLYHGLNMIPLVYEDEPDLFNDVEGLPLEALADYVYQGVPLGALTLPSLRWILRRHHLEDVPHAEPLHRMFIRSAWSVYQQAQSWITENHPQAVVVFNGLQYPEAVVKWAGRQASIPTFTHEIGLMPETAIFTEGEATACPIDLPAELEMTPERNTKLDQYLEGRMKGVFLTAGVQFWQEMQGLTPEFWKLARSFKQVVPVFTNVIFDTSQAHANTVFSDMFDWLDEVRKLVETHRDTLFVIRAHPDEIRPGKESLETVSEWVARNRLTLLPNVLYLGPEQYLSSYDLIRIAKFVMIYNSTIGLEAAGMGVGVLSGGQSRFTPYPITWFPQTREAFVEQAEMLLTDDEWTVPPEFRETARKFMYYQFFHTALSFDDYLQPDPVWRGYVRIKDFPLSQLQPDQNQTMEIILDGILKREPFVIPLDDMTNTIEEAA